MASKLIIVSMLLLTGCGTERKTVHSDKSFCIDRCILKLLESGSPALRENAVFTEIKAYCEERANQLKCCYQYNHHFCGEYPAEDSGAQ
jgi:hypothetical protein